MNDLSEFEEYARKIPLLHDNLQLAAGMAQEIAEEFIHSNAGLCVTIDEFFLSLNNQQTFFFFVGDDVSYLNRKSYSPLWRVYANN